MKEKINISKKLETVDEGLNISMYDNGFLFTATGRNTEGNWTSAKILCGTLEEVFELITESASLPRND